MKTLLNRWFILCCLLWAAVQLARRYGTAIPYFNGYLSDLVAVPVIAQLSLWFQRVAVVKNDNYVLAPWHVVFIFLYISLLFEMILPYFSTRYTADLIDVLLYAVGGVFFYKVMNKPLGLNQ